jgi:hypothetical protein
MVGWLLKTIQVLLGTVIIWYVFYIVGCLIGYILFTFLLK